jgi:hypothetical protein
MIQKVLEVEIVYFKNGQNPHAKNKSSAAEFLLEQQIKLL